MFGLFEKWIYEGRELYPESYDPFTEEIMGGLKLSKNPELRRNKQGTKFQQFWQVPMDWGWDNISKTKYKQELEQILESNEKLKNTIDKQRSKENGKTDRFLAEHGIKI